MIAGVRVFSRGLARRGLHSTAAASVAAGDAIPAGLQLSIPGDPVSVGLVHVLRPRMRLCPSIWPVCRTTRPPEPLPLTPHDHVMNFSLRSPLRHALFSLPLANEIVSLPSSCCPRDSHLLVFRSFFLSPAESDGLLEDRAEGSPGRQEGDHGRSAGRVHAHMIRAAGPGLP